MLSFIIRALRPFSNPITRILPGLLIALRTECIR